MCLFIVHISAFVALVPLSGIGDGSIKDSAVKKNVHQFSAEGFGFLDRLAESSWMRNANDVGKFLNEILLMEPFALKALSDLFSNFSKIVLAAEEKRAIFNNFKNIRERFKQKEKKLKKIKQYAPLSAALISYNLTRANLDKLREHYIEMVDGGTLQTIERFTGACDLYDPLFILEWFRKYDKRGFEGAWDNEMYEWFSFLGEDILDAAAMELACVSIRTIEDETEDEYNEYIADLVTDIVDIIVGVVRGMKNANLH